MRCWPKKSLRRGAQNFSVEKFFIGTDGFNESGAMSGDLMRAEAVQNMIESARRAIILTESQKFSQVGIVELLPHKKISAIYTDENISDDAATKFAKHGVKVIRA